MTMLTSGSVDVDKGLGIDITNWLQARPINLNYTYECQEFAYANLLCNECDHIHDTCMM